MNELRRFISGVAIASFLLLIVVYAGCSPHGNARHVPLQNKSDLLAGFFNAVSYSGYRHGQQPGRGEDAKHPSDAEITEDLLILEQNPNFHLIRLYDCRENSESVLRLIRKNNLSIKVMLGIWLEAELSNHEHCAWLNEPIPADVLEENKGRNKRGLERGIRLANQYKDIIVAVNVGNEALVDWSDHLITPNSIVSYVRRVKKSIDQPVTVADSHDWWRTSGTLLAKEVDFISAHTYPVWEDRDIDEGLSYAVECISRLKTLYPQQKIVITETGWATVASEFSDRASEENQERFYNEITQWAVDNHVTTFFFEAFDEDWKGNPENPLGAEKHWGLFTVDRKAKRAMYSLYPDLTPANKK